VKFHPVSTRTRPRFAFAPYEVEERRGDEGVRAAITSTYFSKEKRK
jgi:hypothetical protein